MKRLLLLVSALFLFGCGAGGTDSAGNTGTNTGGTTTAGSGGSLTGKGVGSLALVFPEEKTASKTVGEVVVPAPEKVRYVISFFKPGTYDEEGFVITEPETTLAKKGDITPGVPTDITLEVGTYRIDMVSYTEPVIDGPVKNILKYYSQTFQIKLSTMTTVTVAMQRKNVFTAPRNVLSGAPYVVGTPSFPFSTTEFWITRSEETPIITSGFDINNTAVTTKGNFSFTAELYDAGAAHADYFQGIFTLHTDFMQPGEFASDWKYVYPEFQYNETAVATIIDTPGGIVIGGSLD